MEFNFHLHPQHFKELLKLLGANLDNSFKVNDAVTVTCLPYPLDNAPSQHHIARGCCDGTNLAKCFAARQIIVEKVVDPPKKVAAPKLPKLVEFTLD